MIKEGKVNCFGVTHHIERNLVDETLLKNNKSPAFKEARKDSIYLNVSNVNVNNSNNQQHFQNQQEDREQSVKEEDLGR
jgi:hypothetical protein